MCAETDDHCGGFLISEDFAHLIAYGGRWAPRNRLEAWKDRLLPKWLTSMWWPVRLRWEPYLRPFPPADPHWAVVSRIALDADRSPSGAGR